MLGGRRAPALVTVTASLGLAAVVRYVTDSVAVMYCGQIVEAGPTQEVQTEPEHPYTRSLLASIPTLDDHDAAAGIDPFEEAPADVRIDPAHPPSGCRFHPRCPIGPLAHPDRTICATDDPTRGSSAHHHHQVACFFASTSPGSGTDDSGTSDRGFQTVERR